MSSAYENLCEELLANLFAFLDSELDATLADRLAAHADECDHCRDAADAELHVRELIRRCCCTEAPATLHVRVREQITVLRTRHG